MTYKDAADYATRLCESKIRHVIKDLRQEIAWMSQYPSPHPPFPSGRFLGEGHWKETENLIQDNIFRYYVRKLEELLDEACSENRNRS